MIVVVNLISPAESRVHSQVTRTFVDENFFCVDEPDGLYKYQIRNVWLVVEKEDEKGED